MLREAQQGVLVKRLLPGENHGDAEARAEQLLARESPQMTQMWELVAVGCLAQMGVRCWGAMI